jgi:uncharacterized protein (DUF302 family)
MSVTTSITYGPAGNAAASFQRVRTSKLPLPEVLEKLRTGIQAAGLWVLDEIDPQSILQGAGHSIGAARQLLFFHPDLMVRLLRADQSALLEAPLKFAVMELPDGTVTVRWFDFSWSFARYDHAALSELGKELTKTCERIIADALGDIT